MLRSFILSLCALFLLPAPLSPPSVPLSPSPTPTPTPSQQSQIKYPANSDLYILMYHNFVAETDGQLTPWTLTQSRFRQDLQWLVDQGYSFVLPGDLAAGKPLPPKAVMLTFDDGYVSNYTIAYPLLQEFHAKAAVALVVEAIQQERPNFLTWQMCLEMQDSGLVEFGSHTYDAHRETICRKDGENQQAYAQRIFPDLETSAALLQENLGIQPVYFAYPHGVSDPWADDFLAQLFPVTTTTTYGTADLAGGLDHLPRFNISMETPVSACLP